jgi:hypothetical protein
MQIDQMIYLTCINWIGSLRNEFWCIPRITFIILIANINNYWFNHFFSLGSKKDFRFLVANINKKSWKLSVIIFMKVQDAIRNREENKIWKKYWRGNYMFSEQKNYVYAPELSGRFRWGIHGRHLLQPMRCVLDERLLSQAKPSY